MPYNTRRKSLSLPSLGIHLPSASRRSSSLTKSPHAADDQMPPSKRVKKSHELSPGTAQPSIDSRDPLAVSRAATRRAPMEHTPPPSPIDGVIATKIDTEGISDDIVVAAIKQLENTGNRPHLVKELAAALVNLNGLIANSANPAALISSRLSAYMKRPWTALAPCPLAKELIPIHPRKVYYYLTTLPRQPLPESLDDSMVIHVDGKDITPSISNPDEEDAMLRDRARLSPSPEVDLSSPDFDDDPSYYDRDHPAGMSSRPVGFAYHHSRSHLIHSNRAASPPLEGDEREFTLTASAVRERASEQKTNQYAESDRDFSAIPEDFSGLGDVVMSVSPSPLVDDPQFSDGGEHMSNNPNGSYFSHIGCQTQQQSPDDVTVAALFGTSPSPSLTSVASSFSSGTNAALEIRLHTEEAVDAFADAPRVSLEDQEETSVSTLKRSIDMLSGGLSDVDIKVPCMVEQDAHRFLAAANLHTDTDVEMVFDIWRELQNPETVEVDELDEMFGEF